MAGTITALDRIDNEYFLVNSLVVLYKYLELSNSRTLELSNRNRSGFGFTSLFEAGVFQQAVFYLKDKVVMKKTSFLHLVALLVLFGTTAPVVAEKTMDDMDKRCRGYAEEDKVPADELDAYIKECIENIKQDSAAPAAEPEPEEKND